MLNCFLIRIPLWIVLFCEKVQQVSFWVFWYSLIIDFFSPSKWNPGQVQSGLCLCDWNIPWGGKRGKVPLTVPCRDNLDNYKVCHEMCL